MSGMLSFGHAVFVAAGANGSRNSCLGGEAMLEANLHTSRQILRSIEFTMLSDDPAWSGCRYGVESLLQGPRIPAGHICAIGPLRALERAGLIELSRESGVPAVMVDQSLRPAFTLGRAA